MQFSRELANIITKMEMDKQHEIDDHCDKIISSYFQMRKFNDYRREKKHFYEWNFMETDRTFILESHDEVTSETLKENEILLRKKKEKEKKTF